MRAEPELEGEGRRTLLPLWASISTTAGIRLDARTDADRRSIHAPSRRIRPHPPSSIHPGSPELNLSSPSASGRYPGEYLCRRAISRHLSSPVEGGSGGRSGDAHRSAHPGGGPPGGAGLDQCFGGPAIRTLVETGSVQLSLCDEQDLVDIRSDLYPGERLMVCRTPLMAQRRAHRREALLEATEALLESSVAATTREKRRLRGEEQIGARVGTAIGRYKMAKHCDWSIDEHGVVHSERRAESIAAEAALDGLSIIRTSLLSAASCKACADVARAPGVFAAPCLASCPRYDAHSGDGLHSSACSRPARRQQRHSYPDAHQARYEAG